MKKADLKVGMRVRIGVGKYSSGDEGFIISDEVNWYPDYRQISFRRYFIQRDTAARGTDRPRVAVAVIARGTGGKEWTPKLVTLNQITEYAKWQNDVEQKRLQRIADSQKRAQRQDDHKKRWDDLEQLIGEALGTKHNLRPHRSAYGTEWVIQEDTLRALLEVLGIGGDNGQLSDS